MGWFVQIHPVWQGLLATLFTYCVTAAGAAFVFFFKSMNQKILDLMMGFAALTSCVSVMETLVANCMELYHKPRKKMCGAVGIYSLVTAVLICLGYNKLYFELKLPNGSVGQLLDVMDYISNSFLMPFISLLTSILIGWVIGPDWIIGEVERNGEHFKRAGLYRFMIRYVVPVVMLILFLVSTGFADLIS